MAAAIVPLNDVREIPNFPGYYADSSGEIWSVRMPGTSRGFRTTLKRKVQSIDDEGYSTVGLSFGGKVRRAFVHQLVLFAFVSARPSPSHEGCHNDGNQRNNKLTNLRWDTQANNFLDRDLHGTTQKGSTHYAAKLTEEIVREIRELHMSGMSTYDLSRRFAVTKNAIRQCIIRKTWRHVA